MTLSFWEVCNGHSTNDINVWQQVVILRSQNAHCSVRRIMLWSIKAKRTNWSSFAFPLNFCSVYFWLCQLYQRVRTISTFLQLQVLPYKFFKCYLNNLRSVPLFPHFSGRAEMPSSIKWLKGATKYFKWTALFQSAVTALYHHIWICLYELLSWYLYLCMRYEGRDQPAKKSLSSFQPVSVAANNEFWLLNLVFLSHLPVSRRSKIFFIWIYLFLRYILCKPSPSLSSVCGGSVCWLVWFSLKYLHSLDYIEHSGSCENPRLWQQVYWQLLLV